MRAERVPASRPSTVPSSCRRREAAGEGQAEAVEEADGDVERRSASEMPSASSRASRSRTSRLSSWRPRTASASEVSAVLPRSALAVPVRSSPPRTAMSWMPPWAALLAPAASTAERSAKESMVPDRRPGTGEPARSDPRSMAGRGLGVLAAGGAGLDGSVRSAPPRAGTSVEASDSGVTRSTRAGHTVGRDRSRSASPRRRTRRPSASPPRSSVRSEVAPGESPTPGTASWAWALRGHGGQDDGCGGSRHQDRARPTRTHDEPLPRRAATSC